MKRIQIPFSLLKYFVQVFSMAFPVFFLRNSIPWMAITIPVLVHIAFLGFGFLPILFTVSFITLSTILFNNFSKHKAIVVQTPFEEDESLICDHEYELQMDQISPNIHPDSDPFSESESINHSSITDHDSDIDWPCSGNLNSSDGSISDEESLIEIALPSGHFVNPEKYSDFWGSKGVFADMNEEDNLIEIDLSIGSIKCSRFEIKA